MARPVTFKVINIDVTTAATPVVMSAVQLFVPAFEVHVPTTNTGSVYIGKSDVGNNSSDGTPEDPIPIPRVAGSTTSFNASERGSFTHGDFFDLSKMYVNADTSGDDAFIQYIVDEA